MVDIKYIGHSAFQISNEENAVLIDPLVKQNKKYDWKKEPVRDILLTHAHSDHIGQAIEIAKDLDIEITAVPELAAYCREQGAKAKSVSLGCWLNFSWGRAIFLPAFHSSSLPDGRYGGCPASIFLEVAGARIYHAGDTCLSSEMKTVKELYAPQIAMLPIGGTYTMDVEHAAMAAKWLGVKTVIPMHYGTFPEIEADVERFIKLVNMDNTSVGILNPEMI
ncbi:MAG: metal-dependent hydrolase [Cyanobacteria bacterium SIG32]|nr:metal-dependent hydrolase [Cyanobacteria bacterium SIG32]